MRDFLEGDHSLKMWFKIMWQNRFLQVFIGAIALMVFLCFTFEEKGFDFWLAMSIPILICVGISYKAFYQYWNDLKNGRSR